MSALLRAVGGEQRCQLQTRSLDGFWSSSTNMTGFNNRSDPSWTLLGLLHEFVLVQDSWTLSKLIEGHKVTYMQLHYNGKSTSEVEVHT